MISTASSWFSSWIGGHVGVGVLDYRELDDALELTMTAGEMLAEARTGRNGRHAHVWLFRQSVFGRLAGLAVSQDKRT